MTQISGHWNGASTGDADTYTINASDGIGYRFSNEDYESFWHDIMCRAILNGTGNRGVLKNWLNELAVSGVATPISVDTGAAIIYGLFYRNTASLNVAVTTPTNDTRYDRVVVRRDWSAQTARVTLITGVEGGGIPEMTQSPAPSGSGVYDIPLATLQVTTGGVITVTDAREYVRFTTIAADDSVATGDIVNNSVDWAQRGSTPKHVRFGGRDLLTFIDRFSYGTGTLYQDGSVAATWGSAAATMEGWQVTGTGTANDINFTVAFKVPADYVVGTSIQPKLWWIDDFAGACSIYAYSAYQYYGDGDEVAVPGAQDTETISITSVIDTVHSSELQAISGLAGDEMIMYNVRYYNSAGAEALLFVGIEFTYTGYV